MIYMTQYTLSKHHLLVGTATVDPINERLTNIAAGVSPS